MNSSYLNTPARSELRAFLGGSEWNMKSLSLKLGLNETYFSQYLSKGSPRILPEDIREALGKLFGKDEKDFKDVGRTAPHQNAREDAAPFTSAPALAAEARELGLDPDAIAQKAVADAVKRKRIDAWIEENREAMEANAKDIRENGMWSDGLRLF